MEIDTEFLIVLDYADMDSYKTFSDELEALETAKQSAKVTESHAYIARVTRRVSPPITSQRVVELRKLDERNDD